MNELTLSVFTPDRSILKDTAVDSIVLPGVMGQFNILPGHVNFITTLSHGVFGYSVKGEWQIAFLNGGFTQVFDGKVTVLAETLEMHQELDAAKAEAELQVALNKWKTAKVGSPEQSEASREAELIRSRIMAASNKLK